jgi:hypothetical protein
MTTLEEFRAEHKAWEEIVERTRQLQDDATELLKDTKRAIEREERA